MPGSSRKSGSASPYEVFVIVRRQPLSRHFVSQVRNIIVSVLGAIEKG